MNCEHYRSKEKNHDFKRGKTATNRILVQITNNAIKVLTQPVSQDPGREEEWSWGLPVCRAVSRGHDKEPSRVRHLSEATDLYRMLTKLGVALALHYSQWMVRQRFLRDQHKDEVVPLRACFHPSCSLLSPKEWQSFTWVTISNSKKNQRLVSSVKKTRSGEREFCETSWLKGARETVQDPDLATRPLLMVWEFTSALLP